MSPSPDLQVERIAQVCHEANRIWCLVNGDQSHVPWPNTPEWVKESLRDGVAYLLRSPSASPGDLHDRWLAHRKADGWKWGEVKDNDAKIHPCLRAWSDLPEHQQAKDRLFLAIVGALRPR